VVSPSRSLRRLPARIGQLLVAPRAALRRIDAEGGGLDDTLWLVALGVVTFRLPQLLEALLGLGQSSSGGVMSLLSVVSNELLPAAWVVIPAAVIVTVAAGSRRDASLDLELGAACYVPFFVIRGVGRAIDALAGARVLPALASEIPAAVAALGVLALAVGVARRREKRETKGRAAEAPAAEPMPHPGRAATRAGAGVLALALVGLGGNAVWAARHMEALRPVRLGQPAPAFELPRLDGGALSLPSLRGRVVVLDFWATWCPPCLALMPTLHDLHGEWEPRGVSFVGVNSDGNLSLPELQAFMRTHPAPYPIVVDDGTANALYKVRALPTVVVIGRDGAVRNTFIGPPGRAQLASALRAAIGE
jgi:thiol-disulfide isomerase/thioredoxin